MKVFAQDIVVVKVSQKLKDYWQKFYPQKKDALPEVIDVQAELVEENSEDHSPLKWFFSRFKAQNLTTLKTSGSDSNNTLEEEIEENLEEQDRTRVAAIFQNFLQKVKPEDIETIKARLSDMRRGPIKEIWDKVQALAQMVKDPTVAWKSKAVAIAALLYLISPLDAVPDVVPLVGLADDAALLVAVVSTLAYELEHYLTRQTEKKVELEIKKQHQIVRITLLGSIAAAVLAIIVKLILNAL